jgi:putative ABC transport system permease protein
VNAFLSELRFAFRSLRSQPGLTSIAVITLAMGIGFTAIMFSIVHGALYRGLPFPDGDRIYHLGGTNPSQGMEQTGISIHDFVEWREQQRTFEDIAAYYTGTINISGMERPVRFDGGFMSASAFQTLGVQPFLGRTFQEGEDRPGAPGVILLSYSVWRDQFGSDPSAVGQVVRVNGDQSTIIGVMPEGFFFPVVEEVWIPLKEDALATVRGEGRMLDVFGMLREGTTVEEARTDIGGIAQRLAQAYPETNEGLSPIIMLYTENFGGGELKSVLLVMLAVVLMVLVVACVNVANLLLARTAGRTKELAIRMAMGASRSRVLAHLLAEATVLSGIGALLGLGIAKVGIDLFDRMVVDTDPPFWFVFALDGPILIFIVAITVLAAVVSGLIPGIKASGADTNEFLKDASRGSSSLRIGRLSRLLVVGEVTLSVGLLVSAGLMIKGVVLLRTMDYGFDREEVFTARVGLFENDFPDVESRSAFFRELQLSIQDRPEVAAVTLATALPGLGSGTDRFSLLGEAYDADQDYPMARQAFITPGFFETFGTAEVQGRTFTLADDPGGEQVVIVNQSFADRHFPGQDPIGEQLRGGTAEEDRAWRTIVGVAPDLYMQGVGNSDGEPHGFYIPLAQQDARFVTVAVRGRGDPLALASTVREEVAALHPDTPLYWVQSMEEALAANLWQVDVFGGLFAIFGFGALFMAAVGLYGVLSFSVKQRTQEVGIRMALGAHGGDVLRLVLKQGTVQVVFGLVMGLGLGWALSQAMQISIFGVEPWDPTVFLAISVVMLATGFLASYVPARRATRVSPVEALRD